MKIICNNTRLVFRNKINIKASYYSKKVASWGGSIGSIIDNTDYGVAVCKIPKGTTYFSTQGFLYNPNAATYYFFYSQDPMSVENASEVFLGRSSYIPDISKYGGGYIAINTEPNISPTSIKFETTGGDVLANFE